MTEYDFDWALKKIRAEARSEAEKGRLFERLMSKALLEMDLYRDRFAKVWMWNNWPLKDGRDVGIDLVAKIDGGGYCAIQCKCYDKNNYIDKGGVDSFITTSGRHFTDEAGDSCNFDERLIITTSNNWSSEAENAIQRQTPAITRLGLSDLRAARINWDFAKPKTTAKKKTILEHQEQALAAVTHAFLEEKQERGRMIMACGTGKTYTALKISEKTVPLGGTVLFLVPSISLLSQSLRDFAADRGVPYRYLAVCSDSSVANNAEDSGDISSTDLPIPPTTSFEKVKEFLLNNNKNAVNIVFSTYQSLDVIATAHDNLPTKQFDLIICDEAHRTVGHQKKDQKGKIQEAEFTKIHDNKNVRGKHRLYMTATPKIYGIGAKKAAREHGAEIYSMDDENTYGKELFHYSFGNAVLDDVLSDYHVSVLCMKKSKMVDLMVNKGSLSNTELDWMVKMAGAWKAICHPPPKEANKPPMRRVVAFSGLIAHSKMVENNFSECARTAAVMTNPKKNVNMHIEARHVDGTMNAAKRNEDLEWLRKGALKKEKTCRVLTNARCLTEGVDVPALDGVIFFSPRKSQIDIVQAVGRVMRKSPQKTFGNIILPVVMPEDATPETVLNNDSAYQHVWQVLLALRAHDERFQARVDEAKITGRMTGITVEIIEQGGKRKGDDTNTPNTQPVLNFPLKEWINAIVARFVENCGDRQYWVKWARDVAGIAESIIKIINLHIKKDANFKKTFDSYWKSLKSNINEDVSKEQAVHALAQHIITKPIFDALFEGYAFSKHNSISNSLDRIVDELKAKKIDVETRKLDIFYRDVGTRARSVNTKEGRQILMETLYNEFFQGGFKLVAQQAGIVYTPTEAVDFINQSADVLLKKEFKVGITSKNVHVVDPFTGTGRFVVRLLSSDIIDKKDLKRKYKQEIHVSEHLLLPYYIANVSIEQAYHTRKGGKFEPFTNGVLCDTFGIFEKNGNNNALSFMQKNKQRAKKLANLPIRVILSNPPYSIGQKKANDNAQNADIKKLYPGLYARLEVTFNKESTARTKRANFDSYIRAIRWAIDRISDDKGSGGGIIGFVTNSGFIRSRSGDGIRKSLMKELSSLYVLDLRGDTHARGEQRKKESGGIFGSGSRTPSAIILMIKNPAHKGPCRLHYHDIGDYLSREDKLTFLKENNSVSKINWRTIKPSGEGDWLGQWDAAYKKFFPMKHDDTRNRVIKAAKSSGNQLTPETDIDGKESIFAAYTLGVESARDVWAYNFSKQKLETNMQRMIKNYNREVERYVRESKLMGKGAIKDMGAFVGRDKSQVGWATGLIKRVKNGNKLSFSSTAIRKVHRRPFCAQYFYYDKVLNERQFQTVLCFAKDEVNPAICISNSSNKDWSPFMVSSMPDYGICNGGAQCFPFHIYLHGKKRDNILDGALENFRKHYKNKKISKADVFYYIYGILHHPEYYQRFSGNLLHELPRIPFAKDFFEFAKVGKKLGEMHMNYENVREYKLKRAGSVDGGQGGFTFSQSKMDIRVNKIRFGKISHKTDKSRVAYNENLIFEIPPQAHEYKVNGRSPVEWVVDRYRVSTDKDSQITQDPNDWGAEHGNSGYILSLLKKSVFIGIESAKLIKQLPRDLGV